MKYENWDIGGDVVKDDARYIVKDNTELNNLVVSSTLLAAKTKYNWSSSRWARRSIYVRKRQRTNGT